MDLLTPAQKAAYLQPLADVWQTFARPIQIYIEAGVATISTNPNWSPFNPTDQNTLGSTAVLLTPQVYTCNACIRYADNQPYDYVEPYYRGNATQLKIRQSDGTVRIKVDATGNALLGSCKQATLDGFQFGLNTTPRPHGLVGAPDRWTYTLERLS